MDPHWSTEIEHESITAENKEAFTTHMAKFPTVNDALANHMELSKELGKPFKLPESMDKLPDDTVRGEFTAQAHKLLGITHAKTIEDLAKIDMKLGSEANTPTDEAAATAFKQFVVDNGIDTAAAQKMVGFHNKAVAAATAKIAADKLALAGTVEAALAEHADFGSKDEVVKQTEWFKRAIAKHVGLTAEESEQFLDGIAGSLWTTNPVAARILIKQFAPLAAEAETKGGGKGSPPVKPSDPDVGSPSYVALGFSTPEEAVAWAGRQVTVKTQSTP